MASAFVASTLEVREDEAAGVDCTINTGGTGLTIIWIFVFFTLVVVGARIYTQIRVTRQFGLSDYLMITSASVLTAFASVISVQFHYGWGRHQSCIESLSDLETQIKFNITGQSFGIMASTFARTSFIIFMISIFGSKKWVKWTLWTLFVLQFVTNLGSLILIYAQCKDPRALYIFSMSDGNCWPHYIQTYIGWAHTAFNGACDAFLAILPTIMVWNLHMKTRLKVGLAILLGMSAVCLVGLIMKCVYLEALSNQGDYSYNTVPMFTWITVEGALVAIAASIPLLRPLVKYRGKGTQASYELPRYAGRSGQTNSSAFSSKLDKVRTSVRGAVSPRSAGFDDDSEEGMLVMQGLEMRNSRNIMVRQEYTVTRETRNANSTRGRNAAHGAKDMHGRREPSTKGEMDQWDVRKNPQQPASAWTRQNRGHN